MKGNRIYGHIRRVGVRRLLWPLVPIIVSLIIMKLIPFEDIINPIRVSSTQEAIEAVEKGHKYMEVKLPVVYYSGYNYMVDSDVYGEYYYDLVDSNTCVFYLFNSVKSNDYQVTVYNVVKRVRVVETDGIFDNMIEMFSGNIDWTYNGVASITKDYVLSEKDYHLTMYTIIYVALLASLVYGIIMFMYNLMYIVVPWLNPKLLYAKFKSEHSLLKMDEFVCKVMNELEETDIRSGEMYVTENFFVDMSRSEFCIVPLDEIKLAYEHSKLKTFLGIHLNVYYTLHLKCSYIVRFHVPKKKLEDVNCILDYFKENRPDILIGYTKENKKLVKDILKDNTK